MTDELVPLPLTERSWLLRSKVNPFPVGGELRWDGAVLSFTCRADAADSFHGWVAELIGMDADQMKSDLQAGRPIELFALHTGEFEARWPRIMGGAAIEVIDRPRGLRWLVSLDYPSSGGLLSVLNLISGRQKARLWKTALAAAG